MTEQWPSPSLESSVLDGKDGGKCGVHSDHGWSGDLPYNNLFRVAVAYLCVGLVGLSMPLTRRPLDAPYFLIAIPHFGAVRPLPFMPPWLSGAPLQKQRGSIPRTSSDKRVAGLRLSTLDHPEQSSPTRSYEHPHGPDGTRVPKTTLGMPAFARVCRWFLAGIGLLSMAFLTRPRGRSTGLQTSGVVNTSTGHTPAWNMCTSTGAMQLDGAPASKRKASNDWGTLLGLCTPDWPLLLLAFGSLVVAAVGEATIPALQAAALNAVLYADAATPLRGSLLQLAGVGVATAFATGIRGFIFWVCGSRLVARLRARLFESLLNQPQEFHDEQGPGELSTRLASDCVRLGDVLSLNVNIILREIIQLVAGLYIVACINTQLAALVLAGVVVRALVAFIYAHVSRRLATLQTNALAASSGVSEQCMSLIGIVRSHGTAQHELARYRGVLRQLLALQTQQGLVYGCTRVANSALHISLLVIVLALGGALLHAGVLQREALTAFVLYVGFIGSASGDVADQWGQVQQAFGSATTVFDFLEPRRMGGGTGAEVPPRASASTVPATTAPGETAAVAPTSPLGARGELQFHGVSFRYPSRPDTLVLDSLNLSIAAGERVAVVGGSGSGKSTIFALALHFYKPVEGYVTFDGRRLDMIPEQELRQRVAWVPQQPPLFPNTTIFDNIAYGLNGVSQAEVEAAAREANCHEFIQALPNGYQTRIGAGAALSGGQRQRIAIARALVRDPALLLLDEATSALDPVSQRRVQAAIERASGRRSVVFTTHKVNEARTADRILVMARGRLIEAGTHQELSAAQGAYAQLLRAGDDLSEAEASTIVDLALRGEDTSETAM